MPVPSGVTRRTLLRNTALGAVAMASDNLLGQTAGPRPNIVFIMADDLGYADVSCYGRPDLSTPNIDGLAAAGVRFLQAYANSAVCSATRTALITGRYQYRLAIGLEEPLVLRDVGLPPEHPTLPSLLKKSGYGTTLVGKWHLGQLPKFGPLQSGYDHFYGFRGGALDYYTHSNRGDDLWDDDVQVHQMGYLTDLLGSRAVEVVNGYAKSGRPFLLSLHFNAPHWPWEAPGDEAESKRLSAAGRGLGGFRRWLAGDLSANDSGDGFADWAGGGGAACERTGREHDCCFHQRQRRGTIRGYVAVHGAQV